MSYKKTLLTAALGLFVSLNAMAQETDNRMWVKLALASGTADFRINVPHDGLLAIQQFEMAHGNRRTILRDIEQRLAVGEPVAELA